MKMVDLLSITEAKPKNPGFDFMLKTKWSTMEQDILMWMKKNGFKQIGSGAYGSVFQHSSARDRIVKVTHDQDRCFLAYLRYVIKNQANPHVPRYYGAKQIPLTPDSREDGPESHISKRRRFFVILEVLSDLPEIRDWHRKVPWGNSQQSYWNFCALIAMTMQRYSSEYLNEFGWVLPDIFNLLPFYGNSFSKELNHFDIQYKEGSRKAQAQIKNAVKELNKIGIAVIKQKKTPLGAAINDVYRIIPGYCTTDLHLGNVMIRPSDGQLVITDPYAEEYDVY